MIDTDECEPTIEDVSETKQFKIIWIDFHREPKCPPNPDYPNGIDIEMTPHVGARCRAALPYPAPRCGAYGVFCKLCGANTICTTAGRPDDPRSIDIQCRASSA